MIKSIHYKTFCTCATYTWDSSYIHHGQPTLDTGHDYWYRLGERLFQSQNILYTTSCTTSTCTWDLSYTHLGRTTLELAFAVHVCFPASVVTFSFCSQRRTGRGSI